MIFVCRLQWSSAREEELVRAALCPREASVANVAAGGCCMLAGHNVELEGLVRPFGRLCGGPQEHPEAQQPARPQQHEDTQRAASRQ